MPSRATAAVLLARRQPDSRGPGDAGRQLASLLRRHLEEEHPVPFPAAFQALTAKDRRVLEQAVRAFNSSPSPEGAPRGDAGGERRLDVRAMPARERPVAASAAFRALGVGKAFTLLCHEEPSADRGPFRLEWAVAYDCRARRCHGDEWAVGILKLASAPLSRATEALAQAPGRSLFC